MSSVLIRRRAVLPVPQRSANEEGKDTMNTITRDALPAAVQPPSRLLQLLEGRALWEFGATLSVWPLLSMAPKGDGHPVLVLPGLVATRWSSAVTRRTDCRA